ncbi:MAG: 2-dehydro-3-deoxygalactonokinase [Sphingomonadales bacterium]|nr:2-dehydro-3-deoxygalactonokinase [Sphingomonadales bacterium]
MTMASFIAIDWGSSAFRAFLIGDEGTSLARISTDDGVLMTGNKSFLQVLEANCGRWLAEHGTMPIIMSGMIGSRNGWQETDYMPCPVSADSLAHNPVTIDNDGELTIRIVPGVSGPNMFGGLDVMRGEEVQVFGALAALGLDTALVCLPGTHSKWCIVETGAIASLTTFMTGEIFALIRRESSISSLIEDEKFDQTSFMQGTEAGRSKAGLLNKLFSIRASVLLDDLHCLSRASYLSGMLIGREIMAVTAALGTVDDVILVGNEALTHRYVAALGEQNVQAVSVEADKAFLKGISLLRDTS